jgi:hypothetical protein
MIGAFGLMWFAVGLGLVVYGANLGHELAAWISTSDFHHAFCGRPRRE